MEVFIADVTRTVENMSEVQLVNRRVSLEMRDLNCLTQEKKEDQQALEQILMKPGSIMLMVLGTKGQGMKLAVVVIDQEEAERLEKLRRIKIGFMSLMSTLSTGR